MGQRSLEKKREWSGPRSSGYFDRVSRCRERDCCGTAGARYGNDSRKRMRGEEHLLIITFGRAADCLGQVEFEVQRGGLGS